MTLFIASQQSSSIKGAGDPLQGAGYVPAGLGAKACPTTFPRTPMVGREPISADWLLILRAFLFAGCRTPGRASNFVPDRVFELSEAKG